MLNRKKDTSSPTLYLLTACDNVAHGDAVFLSKGFFDTNLRPKKHIDLFKATFQSGRSLWLPLVEEHGSHCLNWSIVAQSFFHKLALEIVVDTHTNISSATVTEM